MTLQGPFQAKFFYGYNKICKNQDIQNEVLKQFALFLSADVFTMLCLKRKCFKIL